MFFILTVWFDFARRFLQLFYLFGQLLDLRRQDCNLHRLLAEQLLNLIIYLRHEFVGVYQFALLCLNRFEDHELEHWLLCRRARKGRECNIECAGGDSGNLYIIFVRP